MDVVYDQDGIPLDDYDLDKGYVKKETETVHHEAVEGVPEEGHYETLQEYPNGGKDVAWIVDVPGVEPKPAWDEEVVKYIYIPYTPEEMAKREREEKIINEQVQREEAIREVQTMLITSQINTIAVDDTTALRWKPLYPEWAPNTPYKKDIKARYDNRLYKCIQEHTSQVGWEPTSVQALWAEINESHSGDANDPIPYNNNMALEKDKYYIQDGVRYLCTRETGIPVYNLLVDLVGIYVEVAA